MRNAKCETCIAKRKNEMKGKRDNAKLNIVEG